MNKLKTQRKNIILNLNNQKYIHGNLNRYGFVEHFLFHLVKLVINLTIQIFKLLYFLNNLM